MGRGRAKAKQTKVARELKYRSVDTDFSSLERELRGDEDGHQIPSAYADLADPDDADDDYVNGDRPGDRDGGQDGEKYLGLRKSG